jgi:thiol-disulfide isomerase/thioredoxin
MPRSVQITLFAALFLPVPFGGCLSGPLRGADPSPARVALPELRGADGKAVTPFADKDVKVVVVAFLSFNCPVARDYVEPLSKVSEDYKAKGVRVVGVVPGGDPDEVARQAAEFAPAFPVFADPKLAVADAVAATHTPQVVVIDGERAVRYRGRVDDKYTARLKANAKVTRYDLTEAIDELLAGKPVSVPETECVGCEISRKKVEGEKAKAKVTFYKDVLPILQGRCQECHRPGEAGPFSLLTYREAVTWAADIKGYTRDRKMPPWKQTEGLEFLHDRRMPAAEIATLAAWADGGTPAGDPKDAPPARKFTTGWARGEPDLVLTVGDDFHLGGRGADHYRCFVLPTGLTEDKFLVGYEVRPGNAAVVHHVLNYFDASGTARELEAAAKKATAGLKAKPADHGPGYEAEMGIGFTPKDPSQVGGFGGWAPGLRGMMTREQTGFLLPKGADVILQVHYHRDGKPATDRTRIGLYFATKEQAAGMKRLKTLAVPGLVAPSDGYKPFTAIPPGEKAFRVAGKVAVNEDCRVYAAMPHLHMLGTKVRMTLTPPGGQEKVIVAVGEWDYAWQEVYLLKEPVDVKAGTVFTVEAEYDNSAANRLNPNSPPKEVKRGEGTTDEMLFGFLLVTSPGAGGKVDARPLTDPADYGVRPAPTTGGKK